jgi:hypothetical protein
MRYTRHLSLLALALLVSLFAVSTARADVDEDSSDYRVQARVARISLLSGDVQVRRAGSSEWESAAVNLPLVEGDQLATGRDSRVEIQIDAYNFVRVDEDSSISIVTLRTEGVALSLAEGTATLRLARFEREKEYFEVDIPKTTMAAEARGLYRLDAGRERNARNDVRVTVRDGGRARIYSDTSGFTLREGRTARLSFEGTDESGDWDLASAEQPDNWDEWVEQREDNLARRLRTEGSERYYDSSLWGAEELDSYGDWVDAGEYGHVWRPRATVINNYYNWAPYRYGYWRWCPPYGWTWVGAEPWGWAPYHYGRWVYYNNSWCWSPHSYYYRSHNWWHPGLVVFVTINQQVCWYPVPHHQPDPVYIKPTRASTGPIKNPFPPTGANGPAPTGGIKPPGSTGPIKGPRGIIDAPPVKPKRGDAAYLNAVTSVSAQDFGTPRPNIKPVPAALAQTVINSNTVASSDLPVMTPRTVKDKGGLGNNTTTIRPRDGAAGMPVKTRQTGAATRKPGVALDEELRKTRLYNGRDPVRAEGNDRGNVKSEGTGAVTRPTRTYTKPASVDNSGDSSSTPVRPTRPSTPVTRDDSSSSDTDSQPVRPVRKPERQQVSTPQPSEEPRPRKTEKRQEQQSEPVRSAPPRETAPPPRSEPPPRSDPPPKQESPRPSTPPSKAPDAPVKKSKDGRD